MLLIQGLFIQKATPRIAHAPFIGEVVVRGENLPFLFAGMVYKAIGDVWVGEMVDEQGPSRLFDFSIREDEIRFTKLYLRHKDYLAERAHIFYVFDRREENTWVGSWRHRTGEGGASGPARCVITEVKDALIQGDISRALSSQGKRKNKRAGTKPLVGHGVDLHYHDSGGQ